MKALASLGPWRIASFASAIAYVLLLGWAEGPALALAGPVGLLTLVLLMIARRRAPSEANIEVSRLSATDQRHWRRLRTGNVLVVTCLISTVCLLLIGQYVLDQNVEDRALVRLAAALFLSAGAASLYLRHMRLTLVSRMLA